MAIIVKPLPIKLYVYDLETNTRIREHEFNYISRDDKRQINKIFLWALNNKKAVELVNAKDHYDDTTD